MLSRVYTLLNVKPAEFKVVKQLFLVQFFLGIATAFLFTSTLTLFLHAFEVKQIPKVYLLSAFLLLGANYVYAKLEHAFPSRKLLQVMILFTGGSLLFTWAALTFLSFKWLPFLLSAWNMVVYMLVGYAFWGMAAMLFNVRESKRIFSVVGSGDIPAKLMGYALVPLLTPFIGVENLLWISILAFAGAYYFLYRFQHRELDKVLHVPHQEHGHQSEERVSRGVAFMRHFFHNSLIFSIALFSLAAFSIFSLMDYTLLVEIKSRFTHSPDLAVFIGVFFATGRVLAIFFKLIFSSRVIGRLGLTNALLISPLFLLLFAGMILLPGDSENAVLYIFGAMVLLAEILKSAVQEPAFFVLFQPLDPHIRLKGHLIAKGYMLPFALLGTGLFLLLCDQLRGGISIQFIAQVLIGLIVLWVASVYLVKKEYLHTLVKAIRKGWFTGTELFLNDGAVRELLLQKTKSQHSNEIIMALELLERSGYRKQEALLVDLFHTSYPEVKTYALACLLRSGSDKVMPLAKEQLQAKAHEDLQPELLKAYYSQTQSITFNDLEALNRIKYSSKKAAFVGLLQREDESAHQIVAQELKFLLESGTEEGNHLVLDILWEAPYREQRQLLAALLAAESLVLVKRAIETVGKVQEMDLLPTILQVAADNNAFHALQKALVLFGDNIYTSSELTVRSLSPATVRAVVRAAGKLKGDNSTRYLLDHLTDDRVAPGEVVEALWLKQAELENEGRTKIEGWLKEKLASLRFKVDACRSIQTNKALVLLSGALKREMQHDMQKILKGFALSYDRIQIDRVLKLLQLGDPARIANAIEILEHLVPKRYFRQIDVVFDFMVEEAEEKNRVGYKPLQSLTGVVQEILVSERMHCTPWTKAVACYVIPHLNDHSLLETLEREERLPKDFLFQETKDYILSDYTTVPYAAH